MAKLNITSKQYHDDCECRIRACSWDHLHPFELYCTDHNKHIQWLSVSGADFLKQLGVPYDKTELREKVAEARREWYE